MQMTATSFAQSDLHAPSRFMESIGCTASGSWCLLWRIFAVVISGKFGLEQSNGERSPMVVLYFHNWTTLSGMEGIAEAHVANSSSDLLRNTNLPLILQHLFFEKRQRANELQLYSSKRFFDYLESCVLSFCMFLTHPTQRLCLNAGNSWARIDKEISDDDIVSIWHNSNASSETPIHVEPVAWRLIYHFT